MYNVGSVIVIDKLSHGNLKVELIRLIVNHEGGIYCCCTSFVAEQSRFNFYITAEKGMDTELVALKSLHHYYPLKKVGHISSFKFALHHFISLRKWYHTAWYPCSCVGLLTLLEFQTCYSSSEFSYGHEAQSFLKWALLQEYAKMCEVMWVCRKSSTFLFYKCIYIRNWLWSRPIWRSWHIHATVLWRYCFRVRPVNIVEAVIGGFLLACIVRYVSLPFFLSFNFQYVGILRQQWSASAVECYLSRRIKLRWPFAYVN